MSGEKITSPWQAIIRIRKGEKFADIEPLLDMGTVYDPQWRSAAAGAEVATRNSEASLQYLNLEAWSQSQSTQKQVRS